MTYYLSLFPRGSDLFSIPRVWSLSLRCGLWCMTILATRQQFRISIFIWGTGFGIKYCLCFHCFIPIPGESNHIQRFWKFIFCYTYKRLKLGRKLYHKGSFVHSRKIQAHPTNDDCEKRSRKTYDSSVAIWPEILMSIRSINCQRRIFRALYRLIWEMIHFEDVHKSYYNWWLTISIFDYLYVNLKLFRREDRKFCVEKFFKKSQFDVKIQAFENQGQ